VCGKVDQPQARRDLEVWRHAPPENFEILSPLRVIFKPSESDLRPFTD